MREDNNGGKRLSALIIYKRKNKLYMASDTATSIEKDGLHYRVNDVAKKLYVVGNQLIWCTGILNIAYKIIKEYEESYNYNVVNLSLIAQKHSENLTNVGTNRIIIYVAEYCSGKITLHNLLSNNNFEMVSMPLSNDPEEVTLYTAGAKNEEAFKFACNKVMENDSATYVFEHTMDHIAWEEPEMIGGYCEAYELSSNGIKKIMDNKIKENKNIRYFNIMGSAPDSRYQGGFFKLYNGDVRKERVEIGTYSANDMGVINIKNNNSSNIVEINGNDGGGTINLKNANQQTQIHISSMDDTGANQGIIQLYGEDNTVKLTLKGKSNTDNMSEFVSSDRKTGGFIQFTSYDNRENYFMTVNNENNFGMYDMNNSAFEINKLSGVIINHQNKSNINLFDGGINFLVDDRSKFRLAQGKRDKDTGTIQNGIDFGIPCMICASSASFNGLTGTRIPFAKDLGNTNYTVYITPNSNSNGYLGEYWYVKSTNGFTVYNSGSAVTGFDYMALAY